MKNMHRTVFFLILFLLPLSAQAAVIKEVKLVVAVPTPIIASSTFQRNLTIGSAGQDVLMLQKYLNQRGYTIAKSGSGSLNKESTTFGLLTKKALVQFQLDHRISPQSGYFGTLTRALILKLENDLRLAKAGVPGAASGASGVAGANAGPVAAAKMNASNESNTASVSSTASGTPSISPPPSVSSIARDLSYGSEGWDVLALQTFLNEHGYSVATTSIFDAATLQAVAQFQSDYHLPLSGYVGPFTLSLIVSVENGTYVPGSSTTGDQLIPISHTPVLLQGN